MSNFLKEGGLLAIYVFSKPGFAARQSEKLKGSNKRKAILIDCNINHDMKIEAIHALKDHSLFAIYIEILTKLDKETETYEVSKYHFDMWARRVFGAKNGNYKVEPKLIALAENGLIDFRIELDNGETCVRPELDPPSDTPETRMALRATKTKRNETKQTKQTRDLKNRDVFQDSDSGKFWQAYPKKDDKPQFIATWGKLKREEGFPVVEELIRLVAIDVAEQDWPNSPKKYIPYASTWLNKRRWEAEGVSFSGFSLAGTDPIYAETMRGLI